MSEGAKHDAGKPPWHLLPLKALVPVVEVLGFGAKKYTPDNWRKVPDARNRYFSALLRHLEAWQSGEKIDPDSGLTHLGHAGCCLVFLLAFDEGVES